MAVDLTKKTRLTISEMAKINGVTRQRLIYYDKHGIFQPELVNDKGYRFYSPQQIPYLREICFLKAIGIRLEDINMHIYQRNSENAIHFLQYWQQNLEEQAAELMRKCKSIENRMNVYQKAEKYKEMLEKPFIDHLPERKICFFPWGTKDINRTVLHMTLMKSWVEMERFGLFVENGWGALLFSKNLLGGNILEGAGGYANLPSDIVVDKHMEGVVTIPEGDYACMCKYGMPYETKYITKLVDWIEENNYEITGDILDECFFDTTFYEKNNEVDFCQIQIPIRKKQ